MKPRTDNIRKALREEGVTSPMMDDAHNELHRIDQHCLSFQGWPTAARDYFQETRLKSDAVIARTIGVKQLLKGTLRVKDTSKLIYAGNTFQVLGLFVEWPNDGSKEYLVSLIGTPFENRLQGYKETTISDHDIESINVEPWTTQQ